MGLCRLLVAGILSFDFGGQRELDQAPNCFRARGACHFAAWPGFQFRASAQVAAVAPTFSDRHLASSSFWPLIQPFS